MFYQLILLHYYCCIYARNITVFRLELCSHLGSNPEPRNDGSIMTLVTITMVLTFYGVLHM